MKEYDKLESKFNERKAMIADMILNNNMYVPMKVKEIASLLQVPRDERHVLQEVLDALVKEGTIFQKKENIKSLIKIEWLVSMKAQGKVLAL